MDDRRKYTRNTLSSTVNVFDNRTHAYVGLLADYSQTGVLVTSSTNAMGIGERFGFELVAAANNGEGDMQRGILEAESVWCERTGPSLYSIGFKLTSLTPEAQNLLLSQGQAVSNLA